MFPERPADGATGPDAEIFVEDDFIENLEIEYEKPFEVVNGQVVIPYTIPRDEFKIEKKEGQSVIHFKEHVIVFNTDWEQVWQTHHVRRFAKTKKKKYLGGTSPLKL